jgi:tRNA pseudouridine55 synthase
MLLLDKPVGVTSFQALGACKRLFGTKKVGHAGTLDKFASGLLLVFVGEATRLVPWFVGLDKTYRAVVRFGAETVTLDPEGEVIRTARIPPAETIHTALPGFLGAQDQVPPRYSAIHVDGRRAYERTLAGEELDLKPRRVSIGRLEALAWDSPDLTMELDCSSGTYVRSLARDLAVACGSAAHLVGLRRSRVGEFSVENALPGVAGREEALVEPGAPAWLVGRRLGECLPGIARLELAPGFLAAFRQGKQIRPDQWFPGQAVSQVGGDAAVLCGDDFPGIVQRRGETWGYRLVFPALAVG